MKGEQQIPAIIEQRSISLQSQHEPGKNQDEQVPSYLDTNNPRERLGSTGPGNFEVSDTPLCWTTFLVNHPCLVHIIVTVLTIVVTVFCILNQDGPLMSKIYIRSILPDNKKYSDNYRAYSKMLKDGKVEMTQNFGPQYGFDGMFKYELK